MSIIQYEHQNKTVMHKYIIKYILYYNIKQISETKKRKPLLMYKKFVKT